MGRGLFRTYCGCNCPKEVGICYDRLKKKKKLYEKNIYVLIENAKPRKLKITLVFFKRKSKHKL